MVAPRPWLSLCLLAVLGCGGGPAGAGASPPTIGASPAPGSEQGEQVELGEQVAPGADGVQEAQRESPDPERTDATPGEPPARLSCLTQTYPDAIQGVEARGGSWFVTFADGREAIWNDGRDKDPAARLASPDLEDTLAESYPAGAPPAAVAEGSDPGRARHPLLLANAYGGGERAVRRGLVEVPWPGSGPVRFSSRNGAADALRAVVASFAELPAEARGCLEAPIGSFAYRQIRGTDRLSGHAFGISIDLNTRCGEYWRWQRPFRGLQDNSMPRAIIDAFEAQGFIWGGRWHHFDTFHFEYRPEFFAPACRPRGASRAQSSGASSQLLESAP